MLRTLIAILGIVVLTTTLASRTADVTVHRLTCATSPTQKAKIQHRNDDGARWAPPALSAEPFYLAVSPRRVEVQQAPLLPTHVDASLYDRPPPRS